MTYAHSNGIQLFADLITQMKLLASLDQIQDEINKRYYTNSGRLCQTSYIVTGILQAYSSKGIVPNPDNTRSATASWETMTDLVSINCNSSGTRLPARRVLEDSSELGFLPD